MRQVTLRRVVVTGMGVVAPNAIGKEAYARANRDGRSGVRRIDAFDTSALASKVAGIVVDCDLAQALEPRQLRLVSRVVPLAILAAREAMNDAKMHPESLDEQTRRDVAVILGTGGGGIEFIETLYGHYYRAELEKAIALAIPAGTHGNLVSEISIKLGLRGPSHVLSTGCTSSTDAIGYAFRRVQYGESPVVLVGGADAPVAPGILLGFEVMGVVATRWNDRPEAASRPFSRDREGFVLGEGAWMFVLEERERALARGADILGEILGYASTCDAWHRVSMNVDLVEPVRAVELALQDARLPPEELDYVNLHGTATPLNDRVETAVMKRALGPELAKRIPMSSTKSLVGHPQGACGAAGLAATLLAIRDQFLPPTLNLEHPDPDCDLDLVPLVARPATPRTALCNCMGFGSKNSVLVVQKHPD